MIKALLYYPAAFCQATLVAILISGCISIPDRPHSGVKTTRLAALAKRSSKLQREIGHELSNLVTSALKKPEPAVPVPLLTGGEARQESRDVLSQPASDHPHGWVPTEPGSTISVEPDLPKLKTLQPFQNSGLRLSSPSETPLIFDIPVTYNDRVRAWIRYFQTSGRNSFRYWLERSSRFLPLIQFELSQSGLPQDLAYVAMIESGFSPHAESHMNAMGLWQFISATGSRYGLKIDWWIDERKDFQKSTKAAIRYMRDLRKQFGSWYLVAASYNMGENGVRRLIARHKTNNFWELAERGALPRETTDYVPKILAAILISKAPALYGFRDLEYQMPLSFEHSTVPGGTDLMSLAMHLGVSEKYLKDLNPELTKGYVPTGIQSHTIRVPKGSLLTVSQFVRQLSAN